MCVPAIDRRTIRIIRTIASLRDVKKVEIFLPEIKSIMLSFLVMISYTQMNANEITLI